MKIDMVDYNNLLRITEIQPVALELKKQQLWDHENNKKKKNQPDFKTVLNEVVESDNIQNTPPIITKEEQQISPDQLLASLQSTQEFLMTRKFKK